MYDVMEDHGTTHTSVVDGEGMAVCVVTTVSPLDSQCEDILGWDHFNCESGFWFARAGRANW